MNVARKRELFVSSLQLIFQFPTAKRDAVRQHDA